MPLLHFERPDAGEKMLELVCFYSEDISKQEEVVDEFHLFHTLYSDLFMALKTNAVLPFLLANDMDRAYPSLTVQHRIDKTICNYTACWLLTSLDLNGPCSDADCCVSFTLTLLNVLHQVSILDLNTLCTYVNQHEYFYALFFSM